MHRKIKIAVRTYTERAKEIPRRRRTNKSKGYCVDCKTEVGPGHGRLVSKAGGGWAITCSELDSECARKEPRKPRPLPRRTMVIECVVTEDSAQRLIFGVGGYYPDGLAGKRVDKCIFYPPDIRERDLAALQAFVESNPDIRLITLNNFLSDFYIRAYKYKCVVVGWDLPYQLTRIARGYSRRRRAVKDVPDVYDGGFSVPVFSYIDRNGTTRDQDPRLLLKALPNGGCMIKFSSDFHRERGSYPIDVLEPTSGQTRRNQGYFIDVRTLSRALGVRHGSLLETCRAWNLHCPPEMRGKVTEGRISNAMARVAAIAALAERLLDQYKGHSLPGRPTKIFSAASIYKQYQRAAGIRPFMQQQPDFSRYHLGVFESAFFGGLAECWVRRQIHPVVHLDIRSAYPTAFELGRLHELVIANRREIVDLGAAELTAFIQSFIDHPSKLFDRDLWPLMRGFARIVPDGDLLPVRVGREDGAGGLDWHVALVHARSPHGASLWYPITDLISSALETRRAPRIQEAFVLSPEGVQPGLREFNLCGEMTVDPRRKSLPAAMVELRATSTDQKTRAFLREAANAGCYGNLIELHREDGWGPDDQTLMNCWAGGQMFQTKVPAPETHGQNYDPAVASLVTSYVRLIMALLKRSVHDRRGDYVFVATDAMAIIATPEGGRVAGGIHALSFSELREILDWFERLNPFDKSALSGSILKVEHDSLSRQVYCCAIATYSHAFAIKDAESGRYEVLQEGVNSTKDGYSKHFLGSYIDPIEPERGSDWIAKVWEAIFNSETAPEELSELPAVQAFPLSSPDTIGKLSALDKAQDYQRRIKPFNRFMTASLGERFANVAATDEKKPHLIAGYNPRQHKWQWTRWLDRNTGNTYCLMVNCGYAYRTYADLISSHRSRPESKLLDSDGKPCENLSTGKLRRMHVDIDAIHRIGKETNLLEESEVGLVDRAETYTSYGLDEELEKTKRREIAEADRKRRKIERESQLAYLRLRINSLVKPWLRESDEQTSLSRFAERSGVSRPTINKLLGGADVTNSVIEKLLAALDSPSCDPIKSERAMSQLSLKI